MFFIQVRMDLTWQSFSLIKATLFMESSGGRLHSTLAGYLISMMTPSLTDKARWSSTMVTWLMATVLSRSSMTPNQQKYTILVLNHMSRWKFFLYNNYFNHELTKAKLVFFLWAWTEYKLESHFNVMRNIIFHWRYLSTWLNILPRWMVWER